MASTKSILKNLREKNVHLMIVVLTLLNLKGLNLNAHEVHITEPQYEWGLFLGHGVLADYPASDEYRYRTIPFPYINYYGEIFITDDKDGTRFRILNDTHIDFDLSFGGSFPTETDNNQARRNMPNLDWTLEIGPRILYYFIRDNNWGSLRLGLPLRADLSTDFQRLKYLGYLWAPTLQFDRYNIFDTPFDLYLMTTWNYLSEGVADYFYEVHPQYADVDREAYNAQAGLLGYSISMAVKYQKKDFIALTGLQYSDYSQSANRQSPLHRTDRNWSYFVGLGWVLFDSTR